MQIWPHLEKWSNIKVSIFTFLLTFVFRRLPPLVVCVRRCACVCACVRVCMCMVEREREIREEGREGGTNRYFILRLEIQIFSSELLEGTIFDWVLNGTTLFSKAPKRYYI